jgi:hypothetical protein
MAVHLWTGRSIGQPAPFVFRLVGRYLQKLE